ncbi:MAG: DMT family transporter [Butyricicoccus sp.]
MEQMAQRYKRGLTIAGAIFCCVLWGTAFPCMVILYDAFGITDGQTAAQLLLAGMRFAGAGALLVMLEGLRGHQPYRYTGKAFCCMAGFGLLQTSTQYALLYLSMNWLSGGRASLVNTTNAFLSVLLAHFFCTGDRMNRSKAIGCLIGAAGLVLMCGVSGQGNTLPGDLLMFLSALTFSVGNILCQRLTQRIRPMTLAGWQMLFGGLILCMLAVAGGVRLRMDTPAGWAAMAFLALQSAVTFGIWSCLLTHSPVSSVGIYTCLVPVVGVLTSALLPGEPKPTAVTWLAMLLIALGVACVNRCKRQ